MAANTTPAPVTFYPKVSDDIPWETRKHLQLIYQKLGNHAQAFANIVASFKAGNTTNIENITEGGGGGGGGGGSTIPGLGGVNNQSFVTSYTTTVADNGVTLILDDASPVAVTLNSGVSSPWMVFVANLGAGLATLTPTTGTINGAASFALPFNFMSLVLFDGTNWWATPFPVVPLNTPAVTHQWLDAYNSSTGVFSQTQPAVADVTGAAPIASPTFTGTVTQPNATVLTAATTATSATAGAASALPATPLGYLQMSVNGVTVKIPYFAV